jgi:hypothetical protein
VIRSEFTCGYVDRRDGGDYWRLPRFLAGAGTLSASNPFSINNRSAAARDGRRGWARRQSLSTDITAYSKEFEDILNS